MASRMSFGVLRLVGVDFLAVKQFQCVQHGGGLLGTVLSSDSPQGVLRRLGAVVAGYQDREKRVVRCLVLEVRCQTDYRQWYSPCRGS